MKNSNYQKSCCEEKVKSDKKGFLAGILYGLLPHTFCILFIILSILGTTTATTLLKPLLLNSYFFYILIALSFLFATISALIYLKRNGILSFSGIKRKWKYLSILYGTTIFVNLFLFLFVFPITLNIKNQKIIKENFQILTSQSSIILKVNIPCPGHALLVIEELKKINGVQNVKFLFPNEFEIVFDPFEISKDEILSLNIFKNYKAEITKEKDLQREKILAELEKTIQKAKLEGKYKCCIEPPCTMCYLGDWIFKNGTCQCEEMIAKKEWDKVCPQCTKGIKEGKCKSTQGTCQIF
ncbi:hypothetical protein H5T58_00465 [Candidatus Parcubacteria bacterium]|nr:hypothetical protein [Candidatus Parcubacteria bacterium]